MAGTVKHLKYHDFEDICFFWCSFFCIVDNFIILSNVLLIKLYLNKLELNIFIIYIKISTLIAQLWVI